MPSALALLVLSALLLAASAGPLPKAAPDNQVRMRLLNDGQAEDFSPRIDGPVSAFRNDAHDLVIHASYTRSRIDPHHGGPETDQLLLDMEIGRRNLRWRVTDRDRRIARYRLSSLVTGPDGPLAIVLQRQGEDNTIASSVMIIRDEAESRETRLPDYRGAMWNRVGTDIDGNGSLELPVPDQRFADTFGPAGKAPAVPLIFAPRHGQYVDVSREGAYIGYFRTLGDIASRSCVNEDVLMRLAVRAACHASMAGLWARGGRWPAARRMVQTLNEDFAALDLPRRASGTAWDVRIAQLMAQWGYVPKDQSVRWWNQTWLDYYGDEHPGSAPFEVQMLIYDLQACAHFSDEPDETPDGGINNHVVLMREYHCLRPIGFGDYMGVDEIQADWIDGKYSGDRSVRNLLENFDRQTSP